MYKFIILLLLLISSIALANASVCGDGIVSPGEMCDTLINKCCGPNCLSILPTMTLCRASLGVCDPEERCTGLSADCPVDLYHGPEVECRAAMGACDTPEVCNGCGPECPVDLAAPETTICYHANYTEYPCELGSYCPGTLPFEDVNAKVCPSVVYRNESFVCRHQQTFCDVEEVCNPGGIDPGLCPADLFKDSSVTCELDNLDCSTEMCEGTSSSCVETSSCTSCILDIECVPEDSTCTTGFCSGGTCIATILASKCLIDGICYDDGDAHPYNECQYCNSTLGDDRWSNREVGYLCDTWNPEGPCSVQDTCDGSGVCLDIYLSVSFTCRPASGLCDEPEVCSGTSDWCPEDQFKPSTIECRGVLFGDDCDWPENCTGLHPFCPDDTVKSSGTLCRASEGICDLPEVCNGVNKTCPPDIFRDESFECRLSSAPCDAPEFCLGNNVTLAEEPWLCPTDFLHGPTHICRVPTDLCDAPELCDGIVDSCPPDLIHINGTVCRPASDLCDKEEVCDGVSIMCPMDEVHGMETICRPSNGTCNPEERCPGQSIKSCPVDIIYPDTFVCGTAQGPCENDVTCPGEGQINFWACPPRDFKDTSEVCRPANGVCDNAETCDGFTELCPADSVKPITAACRLKNGPCDRIDFCDGVTKDCPADEIQPNTVTCHTARGPCETSVNCDGVSVACPSFNFLPSSTICRVSAGSCDPVENCDPFALEPWLCPNDIFFDNSSLCRTQTGPCGTPTFCNGMMASCPSEEFLNSTVLCRAAASQCDESEYCNGVMSDCPPNVFTPLNFPCNLDALNCTTDECNGFGQCVLVQDDCECMLNSDCPVNATCIIPSCLNGFCSEALAPGACFIDGVCYAAGVRNPANQCQDCQPGVDPSTWQYALEGSPCQTLNATGICSDTDTCDGMGVCIDRFLDNSTICRAAAGLCDEEERCQGDSDFCPADQVKGIGVLCRNATDLCDEPEYCTANNPQCSEDLVSLPNKTCAVARGPCEEDALCRGSSLQLPLQQAKECPDRLLLSDMALCRASIASCDIAEFCDPQSIEPWLCPDDTVEPSTTVCRPAVGPCDLDDNCDGIMHICPATDNKRPNTYQCNPTQNTCEQPSLCDGFGDLCPANAPEPSTTVCYIAQGSCDMDVNCDGMNITCPNNGLPNLKPNGTQCFTARGTCESDGFCDGVDVNCITEGFFDALTLCRPSIDPCDPEEYCPGNFWECPMDLKYPDGFPCPNAFYCDGDETCLSGVCQGSPEPRDCNDTNPCTVDSCNEDTNQCEHIPVSGIGETCYNGSMDTVNIGQCRSGLIVCNVTDGSFFCQGEVLPGPIELCSDDIDNNCNGVVDEGCTGLTCISDLNCEPFKPSACHIATCVPIHPYHNDTNFHCIYSLMSGFCFINGICFTPGQISPYNPCRDCQPDVDPYWFTDNDTIIVTDNDVCNGVEQCFQGQVIANPRSLDCTPIISECADSFCDPIQGCIVINTANGTNCTLEDHYTCTERPICQTGECICRGILLPPEKKEGNIITVVIVVSILAITILGIFCCFILICPGLGVDQRYLDQQRRRRGNRSDTPIRNQFKQPVYYNQIPTFHNNNDNSDTLRQRK